MPKSLITALTGILQKQSPFTVTDALNQQSRVTASLPHMHNCWELTVLSDGMVLLNPPKVLHDIQSSLLISIEIDLLKISAADHISGVVRTWQIPDELSASHLAPELLTMLVQVYPAQQISRQLFASVITSLIHVLKNIGSSSEEFSRQESVQRLVNFLHSNSHRLDLSLEQLAEIFNLSPQYMNRLLRKNGYPSVHSLLTEIRLVKAKELLDGGEYPLKEVVRFAGWRSAAYFSSCFKRRWGVTPQAYLAKLKKGTNGDDKNRKIAV